MVTKACQLWMLRDIEDDKIGKLQVPVNMGCKWSVSDTVSASESRLRHWDLVGSVTFGRIGLGCMARLSWRTSDTKESRTQTLEEIRKMEEEQRQVKTTTLIQEGQWIKWEGVRQRKITWNELWRTETQSAKFLMRSVFNILPTPTNLVTWGKREDSYFCLCGNPANLEDILSSCRTQGFLNYFHCLYKLIL